MSFLTPGFFDALVLIVVAIGLVLAAIRSSKDFRQGPRWTDNPPEPSPDDADEPLDTNNRSDKP